ncbi:cupin domain-containing protein [Haloarcula marina]|uniref:cupin domain-containing protein n=1 Tax=Haloarcula marina TaxID=2961574 RepID=UPI0020B83FF4|nr:cupin domain-containing protein [Halomicroarcula marina]
MDVVSDTHADEVEVEPGVYLAQLAAGSEMSIQHLRIEPGGRVPEHSHHHEQVGFVYQGEQTFVLDDGEAVTVGPGESYRLESHEVHAAENRGEAELLAIDVFSPPRPNPDWLDS